MSFSFRSLFSLLSPAVCELCGTDLISGEELICTKCLAEIRPSNIHLQADNRLRSRLPISIPVGIVGSFTTYTHDSHIARLIRKSKYNNRPDIVRYLAMVYARQLMADNVFDDIDAIQPIPMHPLKRFLRGFNQSEVIAEGMSAISSVASIRALKAVKRHGSQTKRDALQRATNVRGSFIVTKPELISGKHIAIVDDVTTTGATINESIEAIRQANPRKISVLTLAHTGKK